MCSLELLRPRCSVQWWRRRHLAAVEAFPTGTHSTAYYRLVLSIHLLEVCLPFYPIYLCVFICLSCAVLPCPVLSCPVLCCPALSCPVLCCAVLCCPVLSCPVMLWCKAYNTIQLLLLHDILLIYFCSFLCPYLSCFAMHGCSLFVPCFPCLL